MANDDNGNAAGGGIGFMGLLAILFIALKLTGHIQWSWFWVTIPIWGFFGLLAGIGTVIGIIYLGATFMDWLAWRKRRKRKR